MADESDEAKLGPLNLPPSFLSFSRPRPRAAAAIVTLTNGVARWNPWNEKSTAPKINNRSPHDMAISGIACLTEVVDPAVNLEVLVAAKVEFVAPLLLLHKHPTQRIRVPIQIGKLDDVKLQAYGHEGTLLIGVWYVESYDGR